VVLNKGGAHPSTGESTESREGATGEY
jgi:hypothetical protein